MTPEQLAAQFSSKTDLWATPPDLFAQLHAQYGFELDVCASPENAKCPAYFTKEQDGLSQDWDRKRCWMNPPYGRDIGKWVRKAWMSAHDGGATVVCLLPARTDTRWWHDYVQPILEGSIPGSVTFIKGRLKFGDSKNSAPFPSVVVTFLPRVS